MCQNLTDNDVKPYIWWKRKKDKENREGKRETELEREKTELEGRERGRKEN